MQTDISTSCMCMSLHYFKKYFTCIPKTCFIYDTFFKVGDDVISNLNVYLLFTVLIHYTCNYLSNAPFYFFHFHSIPNQQHLSSSIFQRIKKKYFKFSNCVSSSTKIPSLGLCTFPSRFLYVMY